MKKKLLLGFVLLLITPLAIGQKHYLKFSYGYGLPVFGNQYTTTSYNYTIYPKSVTTDKTYNSYNFSLGGGHKVDMLYGIALKSNIFFEFGLNYSFGDTTNFSSYEKYEPASNPAYFIRWDAKQSLRGKALSVQPSLQIVLFENSINPYIRFGPMASFIGINEQIDISSYSVLVGNSRGIAYCEKFKYESKLSYGFLAALGTDIAISDDISVFGEVKYSMIYYKPGKASCYYYTEDERNFLTQLTVSQKEIEFSDEVKDKDNSNPDIPTKAPEVVYSFNNISFNLGVKICLPHKQEVVLNKN